MKRSRITSDSSGAVSILLAFLAAIIGTAVVEILAQMGVL